MFDDQIVDRESLQLRLRQRLLGRFYLNYALAYADTSFETFVNEAAVERNDDRYSHDLRLITMLRGRVSITLSYRHDSNSSNESGFKYSSNQYGVSVGVTY